jgi:ATP-dependent Lon protease
MAPNNHPMSTRSKKKRNQGPPNDINGDECDEGVDGEGNIANLIDYSCEEEFNRDELEAELSRLRGGSLELVNTPKPTKSTKQKHKIIIEEVDDLTPRRIGKASTSTLTPLLITRSQSASSLQSLYNSPMKSKSRKDKARNDLGGLFMSYILSSANDTLKKKPRKKKKHGKVIEFDDLEVSDSESDIEVTDGSESDFDGVSGDDKEGVGNETSEEVLSESELTDKTTTDEDMDMVLEDDTDISDESEESVIESLMSIDIELNEDESEEESEYDELDTAYSELVDEYTMDNSEDGNLDYFHTLDKKTKIKYLKDIRTVYKTNCANIPLKFKVLNSDMDIYTKSIAIQNLDKLSEMDISTGEYNKMDQWINGLIKLPFGKVVPLPVNNTDSFDKKRNYIQDTLHNMDKAIYGHTDAKSHVLQVIGKWIRNPHSMGNVLAIQGPMGNGKTTLIKNGIAKSLNRPFEFVALGGASDSAFFEGHSYTYEGSRWGRIVDILHKCESMNPIICFDELDKVSDTPKGEEIINMLIHMTDSSQNTKFQDHYYPGIDIDLSKVLFIFSFNDESKINRILKDRMYVIRTKGFETKDKLQIAHNYLLPDIYELFDYTKDDITFTDDILTEIISKYTVGEEGVRNLKRCLESIISTLNIYHLTKSADKEDIIDMKIKDFKLPITLTGEHITKLLKVDTMGGTPEHMYM